MKTTTKVILSISLAMIVVGMGLSAIAWAASGRNIGVIWNPQNGFSRMPSIGLNYSMTQDSVALDAFQRIDVTSDYGNVKLIPSDSYRVEYALFSELPLVEISVENGLLRVDNTTNLFDGYNVLGKSPWGDIFGKFSHETYIYIYYPRSATLTDVTVLNRMGAISVEALTMRGGLDVRANMGEVKLKDITAGRVSLRADMGSVKLDGLVAQSLTAELAMGSLDAEDCVVGDTKVDANMGSVDLQGDFSGNVDVDCAMGSVEVKTSRPRTDYLLAVSAQVGGANVDGARYRADAAGAAGAAYTMTINCNMGGIDLWFGR